MTNSFQLAAGTHIGSIALDVRDLDRSLTFYAQVLGFQLLTRNGGEARLSTGFERIPLITLCEKPGAIPKPGGSTGLFHFALLYPNREALGTALHRLVASEYPLDGASNHGVSEALYLMDPDRNGVELYTDLPLDKWNWLGDQIQMVTEPLDVERLLRESPSHAPAPVHPRTMIGHVHLQVSDLQRSGEFYQNILGFSVTQRSFPGALFLAAGEYHHHLGLNIWASEGAAPPPADSTGLRSFQIRVPGRSAFETLVAHLNTSGIETFPVVSSAGDLEFTLQDPDGIGVSLRMNPEARA